MAGSDFLFSAHFSLDKRDNIGYSCLVGLGRRPGPVGYVMLGSLPLFSSVVPAGGFPVEKPRSRRVQNQRPAATLAHRPKSGRRRTVPRRLESTTHRHQNRGNKARMSMKTKDEVIESSIAVVGAVREPPLRLMRSKPPKGSHRVAGGNAPGRSGRRERASDPERVE